MKRTRPWRVSDSYCPDCSAVDCDGMCTERYLAAREPATLETNGGLIELGPVGTYRLVLEPSDGEAALGFGDREFKSDSEDLHSGGGGYDSHWRRLGIGR